MKRWLALSFGLAIAAVAGYALLSGAPSELPADATVAATGHAEIDEASRARLQKILRQADEEARP
ncbi:MAG: hypothetical protein O7A09_07035 [Proteobacteria bacterium]|nr:hypothetical protein [Pseudomonadota bacterium]MCZ6785274.1 hypothetical protein [Pseudomonadota bacterium]